MTPLLAPKLSPDPERGFERMYRRHVRDVYGFALGVLGNPADAEDVTQTTFLNAYRAMARGDRIENPRAWLLRIAQNVCRQRFRTASRRPQEVVLDPESVEAIVPEEAPAADEIRAAMMHLAFNQRTVLVLREIEGRSYADIAEAMGLSVAAVETLLFRARRALREQLEAAERPLGCMEAEVYISRNLDRRLGRHEQSQLRAHLRACPGCAAYARSQRAQTKAMRTLGVIPLPAGIAAALGWSAMAKAAAVAVTVAAVGTGVAVGTGSVDLLRPWHHRTPTAVQRSNADEAPPLARVAGAAGSSRQAGAGADMDKDKPKADARPADASGPAGDALHAPAENGVAAAPDQADVAPGQEKPAGEPAGPASGGGPASSDEQAKPDAPSNEPAGKPADSEEASARGKKTGQAALATGDEGATTDPAVTDPAVTGEETAPDTSNTTSPSQGPATAKGAGRKN
jgi:RNA polymerase sigma factor (sigma-70 family)